LVKASIPINIGECKTYAVRQQQNVRFSAAALLFNATTEVRDRSWMKRYGPSRRRVQNVSAAALRIFCNNICQKTTLIVTSSTQCFSWAIS
jgi:hypothetical protein